MYQLRTPDPALRPFVEHYWFVTHPDGEPVELRVDVYVDGRADLIFNTGVAYRREIIGGATDELAHSNFDAQRLVPIRISQRGLVSVAGVRFHLGGVGPFVRVPLAPLTGTTPPPDDVFGPDAAQLERELVATDDLDEKAAALDRFLLGRLDLGGAYGQFSDELATVIDPSAGDAPDRTPAARRRRERLFARYLGIPPQTVARIARFQRALRALMVEPDGSLGALASATGYFDQAHFVREFRAMTGGVPRGYRGYFPPDGPADFAPNVVAYVQDAPVASAAG